MKLKKVTHFSVFSHLNNKWQYIAQLYESGGMDEENTDTQVSVLMYWLFCMCGSTLICGLLKPVFFIYEIP